MRFAAVTILLAVLAAWTPVAGPHARANDLPERFSAFAVSLGGPRTTAGTAHVDITIDRWSTSAERDQLIEALDGGQDELLETLRDLEPVGTIRTATSVAYDLRYAKQTRGEDGGRRICLATDRPIGAWEAAYRPRRINYPFTFIELRINDEGQGVGELSLATKVIAGGRVIKLEHWAAQPVQLNRVRKVK